MGSLLLQSKGIWVSLMLAYGSLSDIRKKSLSKRYLLICGMISIFLYLLYLFYEVSGGETGILPDLLINAVLGLAPGGILLVVGRCSGGSIGAADAIMLMFLGMIYGAAESLRFLLVALFIGGVVAIVVIVFRRVDRKSRMSFYPFLLIGFLICRIAVMQT